MFEHIKRIVLPEGSQIIVESQLVISAYWGELIAKYLNARHVINIIEEQFPDFNEKENSYFEFKLQNGDNLNATLKRLHEMFKGRFKEEYAKYIRKVAIPCANVVSSDIEVNYEFEECDFTILSIGRLDKPYIPTMNDEVKSFSSFVGDKRINMIYVGGSHDGSMEVAIPEFFEGVKNLRCYVLGYIYPIPLGLIKRADVAISCANSVLVSANEGVPTIVVDVNDYSAIGVYGYTTKNLFKRETEMKETISSLLKQVLVDKSFEEKKIGEANILDQNEVFEDELSFFLRKENKIYYDVEAIYSVFKKIVSKTKYIIKRLML